MAVILDERLQKACAYRRAHGREARLLLHIDHMHGRGKAFVGFPELLAVDWMPRCWPQSILVARLVGGVLVYMDRRVARYASSHDITISAWHIGPFRVPRVDPMVILDIRDWERIRRQAHDGVHVEPLEGDPVLNYGTARRSLVRGHPSISIDTASIRPESK
jgi:hypothetical protein